MGIQSYGTAYDARRRLIDLRSGIPVDDGRDFLLALFNRTGAGTGIVPKVSDPLVAAGATIIDALGLTGDWNLVATVAAGSGVQILPLKPGNDIQVYNAGLNNLSVYPPPNGSAIDALGVAAPYVLVPGKLRIFQCWSLTQFYSTFGN